VREATELLLAELKQKFVEVENWSWLVWMRENGMY
jgi:hypothetical protein